MFFNLFFIVFQCFSSFLNSFIKQHRYEHERHPAFKRESEFARNAVEPSSPEFSGQCTARLARNRRQLEEVVQSTGTLHFDGRRSDMHV